MGVKEPGAAPMTYDEVMKMVDKKMAVEQSKLYKKSTIFTMNPPYNFHAKENMAFAPFYPEMDKVGYNHKVHGTHVIPDYRVYNVERSALYSDQLAEHVEKLEKANLKDPWLRNEVWRQDPFAGFEKPKTTWIRLFKPGIVMGGALAITHFLIKTAYESIIPPPAHKVDKWWEERETPEPNEIHNRIRPHRYRYGVISVSRDPRLERNLTEDYGVEAKPPRQWYKKENDPALF